MKIQISFLGRARQDPKTGYRSAHYRFEDGAVAETAFFGTELARRVKPDAFYILGTAGSMWDVLLDAIVGEAVEETHRLELWDSASRNAVTQERLSPFEPPLSRLLGCACHLRVISYADTLESQIELVAALAEWVKRDDRIVFDVTHGLRHLPMLMLVAAHYLERVSKVTIEEIYYGALEMASEGLVPVLRLTGLLRLLDWVEALSAYDASGNYGVFSRLLEAEGVPADKARALAEAAHFERISDATRARSRLSTASGALQNSPDTPLVRLFLPELLDRLEWWRTGDRAQWEAALARRAFERGDYLRAAIYAQESVVSRTVAPGRVNDFPARNETRDRLRNEDPKVKALIHLRNAMAHGVSPTDPQSSRALRDENTLRGALGSLLRDLLS